MKDNELATKEFLSELKVALLEQNQLLVNKISEVSQKVDVVDTRLEQVEATTAYLMNERPVSRSQAAKLRKAIAKRVCKLLEVPERKSDRTFAQQVKYEKYSKALFGRCYSEIPNDGHLDKSSYLDTPVGNYDRAMSDIDVFVPASGMTDFYADVDKIALAKKIAKEQGY